MNRKTLSLVLLLLLFAVAVAAAYAVVEPFLWPILTALVLAIAFYPLCARLELRMRTPGRAALATVLLGVAAVMIPLGVIGVILTNDIYALVDTLNQKSQESGGFTPFLQSWLDRLVQWAAPVAHMAAADVRAHIVTALKKAQSVLVAGAGGLVGNAFALLLQSILVTVFVFFFLRDGRRLAARITPLILLDRAHVNRLLDNVTDTIQASMYGILSVAAVQALLMGLGLWIMGVPGAVLWGAVTLFASLIPIVGASLVWLPAALYLLVTAGWVKALLLALWGAVLVGSVDNILRPILMQDKVRLHPLALLLALLGGTQVFGLLGLFAGPVIMAVAFALLDIVELELREAGLVETKAAAEETQAASALDTGA